MLTRIPLYVLLIGSVVVASLIFFGTAKQPPPEPAITGPFAAIDDHDMPPLRRYRARDGAQLTFREYPGSGRQVAVLIHGSAGSSRDLHPLALELQAAGVNVLVPDLRGHGWNRPHGDIAYVGQLDDDLTDFIATQKPQFRTSEWTAVGFSSGGGFTLRIAAEESLGQDFDRYILISPYLRHDAPSVRGADSEAKRDLSETAVRAQTWAGIHRQDNRAHHHQFSRCAHLGRLAGTRLSGTHRSGRRDLYVLMAPAAELRRTHGLPRRYSPG